MSLTSVGMHDVFLFVGINHSATPPPLISVGGSEDFEDADVTEEAAADWNNEPERK